MTRASHWAPIVLLMMSGPLAAQRRTAYWVDLGLGGGWIGTHGSLALHGSYNYQRGTSLFTVRGSGVVNVVGALLNVLTGQRGNTAVSDLGLLYGRAQRPGHVMLALSAGIGIAQVTRDSAGTSHRTYHPSLPLEAQIAWRPVPAVGFMALGFASLNNGQSFSGIVGGVQVGRLF